MLHCIKSTTVRLWNDESGASLLEYSVLIGLIVAGVVASIVAVANWTGRPLDQFADCTYQHS